MFQALFLLGQWVPMWHGTLRARDTASEEDTPLIRPSDAPLNVRSIQRLSESQSNPLLSVELDWGKCVHCYARWPTAVDLRLAERR